MPQLDLLGCVADKDVAFQKEIHEQPESLRNTMRGRIQTAADQRQLAVMLGGMREHVQVRGQEVENTKCK